MLFIVVFLYSVLYFPCLLLGAMWLPGHSLVFGSLAAFVLSCALLGLIVWTTRAYQPEWAHTLQRAGEPNGTGVLCFTVVAGLAALWIAGSPTAASLAFIVPVGVVLLLNGLSVEIRPAASVAYAPPSLSLPLPGRAALPSESSGPALLPGLPGPSTGDDFIIQKTYQWQHEGTPYSSTLSVRRAVYEELKNRPRILDYRRWARDYVALGITGEVRELAAQLSRLGSPFQSYQEVALVLAFVQQIVQYETEEGEYPRAPVESLVEQRGDCEDFSILAAAILHSMGYQTALLYLPGHAALGVAGAEGVPGVFKEHLGIRYYFCEMTDAGWRIGELPEKYAADHIEVSPIPAQVRIITRPHQRSTPATVSQE